MLPAKPHEPRENSRSLKPDFAVSLHWDFAVYDGRLAGHPRGREPLCAIRRSSRCGPSVQSTDAVDESLQKKMDYVQKYVGSLNSVRGDAERKLRDEHSRLSHVEDHIRRLQEQMRSLQLAAVEFEALEQEHYDDREQAEREVERLNQLIDGSRKTIASLQEEALKAPASYAVVPYEGPNGTFRRPMYIECVKDGVVLQPEGVHISANDLRPPYGAGNPLAAALRAAAITWFASTPKKDKAAPRNLIPCCSSGPKDWSCSIAPGKRSRPVISTWVSNWSKTIGT